MPPFALDHFPAEESKGVYHLRAAFRAGIISEATDVVFEPIAESMIRAHFEYAGCDPDIEPVEGICWMSFEGPNVRLVRDSNRVYESLANDPSVFPSTPAERDEAIRNKQSYITVGPADWINITLPKLIEATHLMNGGPADSHLPAPTIDLSLDSVEWSVDCALEGDRLILHGVDRVQFDKVQMQGLSASFQGFDMGFENGTVTFRPPRVSLWRRLFGLGNRKPLELSSH